MRRSAYWATSVVCTAVMLVGSQFVVNGGPSPASAAPQGEVPTGGGVPTTPTDPARYKNCPEPDGGTPFATATPDEVGLDAAMLQQASDFFTRNLQTTMRVYRFGCLVHTSRLDPVFDKISVEMYSTTKPIFTLVLGRAVQLGYLSVDDPLSKFFPGEGDAAHGAITIRQMLNHTSGVRMVWENEVNQMRADSVKSFFALPIDHAPGTHYQYAQIPCTVLTAAVQKAVGQDFQAFAQKELFDKIGILPGTWLWKRDRAGWTEGFINLWLRPRDMARVGQLMLQSGEWKGEQLIPESFMQDMVTGTPQQPAFGFNTWVNSAPWYWTIGINSRRKVDHAPIQSAPDDLYYSWGWRGRHIFVMPKLQLVVTSTPLAVQYPLAGQIFDGYSGHDVDWDEVDAHQIGQGEQRGGYHEFFRILMRGVTDQRISDPGPWTDPPDRSFDPDPWTDADTVVKGSGPGDTNADGFGSWAAEYPGIVAKSLATE